METQLTEDTTEPCSISVLQSRSLPGNSILQPRDTTKSLLRFRPITPDTLPLVNSILQLGLSRTCDYTIGGIYMWIKMFRYEYCVFEDTLFIKGLSELDNKTTVFSLPIGPMPLERAVCVVDSYCRDHNIPTIFSAIPGDRVEYLLSVCPDGTDIVLMENWNDYLYDIRSFAELSGKHLAKKRNHVNRFITDNPEYTVEPLNHRNLPEVLLFNSGREDGSSTMEQYEHSQCVAVLNHYSSYPFEGIVLRDNTGEICAYTCGEVLGDTLYVHIEKMNHEIAGAGEMVAHLYARDMLLRHPGLRYLNREEDCGDEGLRQSKLSWNPVQQLEKYEVRISR